MKILLTGAAGFIGHHVVEHLLKNTDAELLILDKLTYASNGTSRLSEVLAFSVGRVKVFPTDISKEISWGLVKSFEDVDYIVHMAAETHVDNSIGEPWPFVEANVLGTYQMLELARKCSKLKKFFYFSTDEVFGPASQRSGSDVETPDGTPETYCLNLKSLYKEWDRYNSSNPYSATKAAGEELVLAWANTYGLPVAITHTMNAYGERQHPEKFIPKVVKKLISEEKISIHANKDRTKSGSRFYIHCRNIADAILFLMNHDIGNRDKFNIVGEREISNEDLVKFIHDVLSQTMGRQLPLNYELVDFHSSRPGHDLRYALDGSKMKSLGWEPPASFEDSLTKTINWMIQPQNLRWLMLAKEKVSA